MAKFKFYALWLSLVCIILFIFQSVFPYFTDLLILNQNSFQEPWRFVTSIFLHASPIHLIYNLFALILFGLILEKLILGKRFLLVFFATGIIANLISVNFYSSSLGASGAIMGILGALTILRPKMFVWAFGLPMPMFIASILWIIGDIIQTIVPSNIGTIAHLSGIAIGFLFGLFFRLKIKQNNQKQGYKIKIPDYYLSEWEKYYLER